jgi:hypothetical protein
VYHGYIDVPTFAYFDFGNTWIGSLLSDFNYRIVPLSKEEPPVLKVSIWYGDLCFDLSETAEEFEEEFSAEGYERVISRLNEKIESYKKSGGGHESDTAD